MSGRKTDVIIQDIFNNDMRTGVETLSRYITVFADADMKGVILSVEGVVTLVNVDATEYMVKLDPRYDREFVKRQIEAAILCKE